MRSDGRGAGRVARGTAPGTDAAPGTDTDTDPGTDTDPRPRH